MTTPATRFAVYSTISGSTGNVVTDNLADGAVTTPKLADNAVTPAKADLTTVWNFTSGSIKVPTPVSSSDAANRTFVLTQISASIGDGVAVADKGAARLTLVVDDSIAPILSYSAASKTLTTTANMSINDGQIGDITDFAVGNKILLAYDPAATSFAASGSWSGPYSVTDLGSAGSPFVLTRTTDFDSTSDIVPHSFIFVANGKSGLTGSALHVPGFWYLETSGSITFESTPLKFVALTDSATTYSGSAPIIITGTTISLGEAGITPFYASSSLAGNGLTGGNGTAFSVVADAIANNPVQVTSDGVKVREASDAQSGYLTAGGFTNLGKVVEYANIPSTIGNATTAITTSNNETAWFNVGVIPANTIWTVEFRTFSVDVSNSLNQVSNIGAANFYRSGSSNVVPVGSIQVQNTFISGSFTSVNLSASLATDVPGRIYLTVQGINTYDMKHLAKFHVTEFVIA